LFKDELTYRVGFIFVKWCIGLQQELQSGTEDTTLLDGTRKTNNI